MVVEKDSSRLHVVSSFLSCRFIFASSKAIALSVCSRDDQTNRTVDWQRDQIHERVPFAATHRPAGGSWRVVQVEFRNSFSSTIYRVFHISVASCPKSWARRSSFLEFTSAFGRWSEPFCAVESSRTSRTRRERRQVDQIKSTRARASKERISNIPLRIGV